MPDRETVQVRIDEIETEMKSIGMWHAEPLPPEAYDFHRAFAMDTMTFSNWLQFIFVPRVNQIIDSGEPFPTSSSVGAQAVREFDGDQEASRLCDLLSAFDRLIERG
jgi:uncharacterized protein YqcC (DUF446 family)